jgi:hypothetical protein
MARRAGDDDLIVFAEAFEDRSIAIVTVAAAGAAASRSSLAARLRTHRPALIRARGGCLREPPKALA